MSERVFYCYDDDAVENTGVPTPCTQPRQAVSRNRGPRRPRSGQRGGYEGGDLRDFGAQRRTAPIRVAQLGRTKGRHPAQDAKLDFTALMFQWAAPVGPSRRSLAAGHTAVTQNALRFSVMISAWRALG